MSSFSRKFLRATFYLANGDTFQTGQNTLAVAGLRIISETQFAGGTYAPTCDMRVYGLLQSDMNKLTMLNFQPLGVQRNNVRLEASTDGLKWNEVFFGNIFESGPNYQSAPDVFLSVLGMSLYVDRIAPFAVSSYPTDSTDVVQAISQIAKKIGVKVEPNDASGTLSKPYLPNTAVEQINTLVAHANLDLYVEGGVIALTPKGVPRNTPTALLSPVSGLVGYPTLNNNGIKVTSYYRPDFRFGGTVRIEGCDVPKANGLWRICGQRHVLESERPGAQWLTHLDLTPPNIIGLTVG